MNAIPLFLIILVPIFIYHFFQSKKITTGFKIYPLVGILPQLLKNRHRFLEWTTEILAACPTNTSVLRRPGNVLDVITANPSNVEHILKNNFDNYPKGDRFTSPFLDLFGLGLFTSEGERWKLQRKMASYEMNTKSFRNFVMESVAREIETRMVPVLDRASESGLALDLQEVFEQFGFDNACKLVFDVDVGCLGSDGTGSDCELMRAYDNAAKLCSRRIIYLLPLLWKVKRLFNWGSEKRLKASIAAVHGFVDNIIRLRINEVKPPIGGDDILSRIMIWNDIENMPENFLRDMTTAFLLGARDTMSSALTWLFWLISSRPEIEQNILNELEQIRVRNGKNIGESFSFEELRELHYLQAAISETMRLYPPVPLDSRMCLNDDILPDGTFVGKDWTVTYHAYAIGRLESVWGKDCLEFRPERWLEDGVNKPMSPYRYPIFHAGPRMCLGKDIAYIQMKSIAATVIEKFEINVLEKETCPKHSLAMILRMKDGLPVTVKVRNR